MGIFATIDLVPAADEAPASVLLRPKENLLVLEVLHYRHQVTQPAALASEAPQTEVAPEELKMAKTLVNASTGDFTLDKYPDLYTRKLQQLIEAKVAGKEIVAAPASEGPQVDQPDGGLETKRGPSPGDQLRQEGIPEVHPPASPQDLLRGSHGPINPHPHTPSVCATHVGAAGVSF
jgi:hypothetical protein